MARKTRRRSRGVTLVTAQSVVHGSVDRLGGETHGLWGTAKKIATVKIDEDVLRQNLDGAIQQLQGVLQDLRKRAIDGWLLESVSVSLAVSAEGSVGVATAGMEASIAVTFAPKS